MRNSYLLYAMGAGLAFTACSSEENVPNVDSVLEKDQSFYVNVAITTNSDIATRANSDGYNGTGNPDFEKGEKAESEVDQVYFVFYDTNGIVVGQPVSVNVNDLGTATDYDDGNIFRSYTSVVKVDVNKGEGKPAQVMCYVNPVSTDGLASSLQIVETLAREEFQDNDNHFSMSNSVYYTDQNLTRAVSIKEGQLFNTEKEAIDAVGGDQAEAARVLINVERYAAKVKFSYGEGEVIEDYTPATSSNEIPISLTFVPEKWDVNATDKNTFVTKAFRTNEGLGSPAGTNMTFNQVNTELDRKDNWEWNSTINARSYWAFSPAYYSNDYPSIAHDIIGNEAKYSLNYLTYNNILTNGLKAELTSSNYRYTNETTVARSGLDSSNPAAAISSAVLAGHYEVYVNGATDPVLVNDANPTFYTMGTAGADNRAQVFFGATLDADKNIVSEVAGAPTMIEYMADKETVLLVRQGTGENATYTPLTRTNLPNVFNALEIKRPNDDVYGQLGEYSASRTVTLQIVDDFQSLVDAGYALCINVGNGAQEIGEGEGEVKLVDANAALARATQWANRYNEGRAFFNIPIKHLGWYAGTNPNAGLGNSVSNIDYSAARVGDFGLVRNHVYNIVVDHIRGLGTAVSEPGEPIVPPVETKEYFVAYRLNILNWAIVPVQNVDL